MLMDWFNVHPVGSKIKELLVEALVKTGLNLIASEFFPDEYKQSLRPPKAMPTTP